ncbi:phage terminase large subunit family protein [Vannielia litorea]|uniref:Phage terminase, large subunit GpA n=1 Tax=Vannielia litorea TaxID=1217970 RepID=A0A1N6DUC3_9RHOB|nr:terminase gpA endonuclease subunit [Vannielia litorea]SIN74340.1 Phage terminase, large subunit GpA [Vannielia litorea]
MTVDPRFGQLRRDALAALRPPAKLALSEWIQSSIYLPSSLAAQPGRMRLWKPQIEIADSIGDDTVERVSILKSARVGATQLMVGALGHFVENDPSPVLCVVPAEADARHLMVSVVEPTFGESPALRAALTADASGRDVLMHRHFAGGSLSIVSARAPRNLRARTARILFADEIDAYELSAGVEGDPVELAMRRTMTFGNRKIVLASTPVDAETSRILRAYDQSDKRVFEVPCPGCGDFGEILWKDIRWDAEKPETAHWVCPECGSVVEDRQKPRMVAEGRWRATAPHVEGHRGYKLTSLTSTLPNASWTRLAAEFLQAKRSPTTLKPWLNTVLGEPWRGEGDDLDATDLEGLRRPFSLSNVPPEALVLTAGADVQKDRVEITFTGWTKDDDLRVLGHDVIWGSPTENETWAEVDDALRRQFRHPAGGVLTLDAAVIDSGNWADQVYAFCRPRSARRILPGKGVSGFGRQSLAFSTSRSTRLALIGIDGVKLALHQRLAHGDTILFSDELGGDYFDQLRAERLVTKFSRGHPIRRWEVISGRRNEALDTLVYSYAARGLVGLDVERREADLASVTGGEKRARVIRSNWLGR